MCIYISMCIVYNKSCCSWCCKISDGRHRTGSQGCTAARVLTSHQVVSSKWTELPQRPETGGTKPQPWGSSGSTCVSVYAFAINHLLTRWFRVTVWLVVRVCPWGSTLGHFNTSPIVFSLNLISLLEVGRGGGEKRFGWSFRTSVRTGLNNSSNYRPWRN